MAIYHFSATTGTLSGGQSARAKFDYIAREGSQHEHRDARLHVESAYMPKFAAADAAAYWSAADDNERANGRLFKHIEIALPRELTFDQNLELARAFCDRIATSVPGGKLPYTFTIHAGGGSNPHFDVMFSERLNDAIDRGPEIWFSRAATGKNKTEADGGARKTDALKPKKWLFNARKLWADIANDALAKSGHSARIDHRSLVDQRAEALLKGDLARAAALDRAPGEHIGPKALAFERRHDGKVKSNRRKHIEHRQRERHNIACHVVATERIFERLESQIRADEIELRRERGLRAKEAMTRRIAAERAAAGKTLRPVSPAPAPAGGPAGEAKVQPRIQKLGKLPPRLRTTIPAGMAQWGRDAIKALELLVKSLERIRQQREAELFEMHQSIQRAAAARRVLESMNAKPAPAAAPAASQRQDAPAPTHTGPASAAQDERDKLRKIVDRAISGQGIKKSDALIRAASAADSESVDRLLEAEAEVLPKSLDAAAKGGDDAIFKKLVAAEGTATDAASLRYLAAKCGPEARLKLHELAKQAKAQGGIEGLGIDPPQQLGTAVEPGASTNLGKPS